MALFDFFKNIFDGNAAAKDEASVTIVGDEMVLVRNGYKQIMNLSLLHLVNGYVSDDISTRKIDGLFLESDPAYTLFIPSFADGYHLLTAALCARCNLSFTVFQQWDKIARGHRWLIWKKYDINNVVLASPKNDEAAKDMYFNGLWVESTKSMLLWSTPIMNVMDLPYVSKRYGESIRPKLAFETAVYIGSIGIKNLFIQATDHRLDVPAKYYTAKLLIDGPSDNNYFVPKQAWTSLIGIPQHCHEDEQGLFSAWDFEGIRLSLSYTYDGPKSACSGEANLHIDNGRNYPECWQDDDYERNFAIDDILHLPLSFEVPMDWRNNPFVRPTPEGIMRSYLTKDKPYVIWIDDSNAKIGFANAINAVVIPTLSINHIRVEVWMPDKGEVIESLLVNILYLGSNFDIVVAKGCVDDVWNFKTEIASFLDMSVERNYI